jgi:methanogenic corrinoid protein MtbC1
MHSIKTVALLTGLTTETIRAWERRYQTVNPSRDGNGRRTYSEQDLERLQLLAELSREGHSIGKLTAMSQQELLALKQQNPNVTSHEHFTGQIIDALMEYRVERCEELLRKALMSTETLEYVRDILSPCLKQVGELWHEGKISIAQEHFLSACVERLVFSYVNNIRSSSIHNPAILFATPQGETHEFGILLSMLIAASLGFNCLYLGRDIPVSEIIEASIHLQPNIILLGVLHSPPERNIVLQLEELANAKLLPESTLWIGGLGATDLSFRQQLNHRFDLIADFDDFYQKSRSFKMVYNLH